MRSHPYMVMEYMVGGNLQQRLGAGRKLGVQVAVAIAIDGLAGLAACHEQGIVHRDVKPANILFDQHGMAKIADLGLARGGGEVSRLTETGDVVGTPIYMSPEQVTADEVGPASDLYSIGLILYEMLAGRRTFEAASLVELLHAQVSRAPTPLDRHCPTLPAALVDLVHAAIAKNPVDRPATAAVFARRLAETLKEPEASVPRTRRSGDRGRHAPAPAILQAVGPPPVTGLPGLRLLGLMALFTFVGVALGTYAWFRGHLDDVMGCRIVDGPAVTAGVTCARIRWTTDRPTRSALVLWKEGQQAAGGRRFGPAPSAKESLVTHHQLSVCGLEPGAQYRFRLALEAGRSTELAYPLMTRESMAGLVSGYSVRMSPPFRVDVSWNGPGELTAGLVVTGLDGNETVHWATGGPTTTCRLGLSLDPSGRYRAHIRFREFEGKGAAGVDPNRLALRDLTGPLWLKERVAANVQPPLDPELEPIAEKIVSIPYRIRSQLSRRSHPPGKELVARLDDDGKRRTADEARRFVHHWLESRLEVGIDDLGLTVPLWWKDPSLSPEEQWSLYSRLMAMWALDGAAELVAGRPTLDLDALTAGYVSLSRGRTLPATGHRPISLIEKRPFWKKLGGYPLPLSGGTWDEAQLHWMDMTLDLRSTVLAVVKEIAQELGSDTDVRATAGHRWRWYDLGTLPPRLTDGRPLRVGVKVANLDPGMVMVLRFGRSRRLYLRNVLASYRGFVSLSDGPTPAMIRDRASTILATVPRGFLRPDDARLALSIDACLLGGTGGDIKNPHICWIDDLVVAESPEDRQPVDP
ncbi:MAG: serine/threonine protein kinase [Candidatus Riflebacteria bacterium]|nr:serine/threonine protein kinase [Candidatus Riflebacteria bacterium]